jgi:hypothetical protein
MKDYWLGLITGFIMSAALTSSFYIYKIKNTKPIIDKVCTVGTITIRESSDGVCYYNNGFIPTDFIIDCKDKEKILRKGNK